MQIAWIVEAEIGCYCGALDLIDFSVFSIMRPPAATSSKRESSLLYLGAALIQHPRQHFRLKSGRSGCHTLKRTTGNDRRGMSRMQQTLYSRTGFKLWHVLYSTLCLDPQVLPSSSSSSFSSPFSPFPLSHSWNSYIKEESGDSTSHLDFLYAEN